VVSTADPPQLLISVFYTAKSIIANKPQILHNIHSDSRWNIMAVTTNPEKLLQYSPQKSKFVTVSTDMGHTGDKTNYLSCL
jgi:hypothetical protein